MNTLFDIKAALPEADETNSSAVWIHLRMIIEHLPAVPGAACSNGRPTLRDAIRVSFEKGFCRYG
jgi:hypothetical protein